jgi:proteasome lid subunit RPN8/RPN11
MNKLPEQQILEEAPLYIRWSPDRSPYTLELKLDLVPEIARELAQGERLGIEVGGVLIGSLPDGDALTLRVEDMEMVRHPPEEGPIYMLDPGQHERFSEIRTRAASRGKRAVGFFRTHLRPGPLRPSLADRTFLSSEFTEPVYAVLLIQGREPHTAAFFLASQGELAVHPSVREFRFSEAEFRSLPEILAEGSTGIAQPMPPAAKTRSGVLAAFLLIAFAITLALWFISRGGNWLLGSSDRVDLSVVGTGELLKISWNHDAREVTHATGAALVIEDGPSRRQVALGPDELKLGVVEYQRVAPRVHVSMILHTATSLQSTASADWAQK